MALFHALLGRLRASWIGRALAPLLTTHRVDEPVARGFRARQLQAVLRLTPLTMSANALNVVLVAAAFWGDAAQRPFLLMWGLGIAVVVARRAWAATNSR